MNELLSDIQESLVDHDIYRITSDKKVQPHHLTYPKEQHQRIVEFVKASSSKESEKDPLESLYKKEELPISPVTRNKQLIAHEKIIPRKFPEPTKKSILISSPKSKNSSITSKVNSRLSSTAQSAAKKPDGDDNQ